MLRVWRWKRQSLERGPQVTGTCMSWVAVAGQTREGVCCLITLTYRTTPGQPASRMRGLGAGIKAAIVLGWILKRPEGLQLSSQRHQEAQSYWGDHLDVDQETHLHERASAHESNRDEKSQGQLPGRLKVQASYWRDPQCAIKAVGFRGLHAQEPVKGETWDSGASY